jgi:hypothetical protein
MKCIRQNEHLRKRKVTANPALDNLLRMARAVDRMGRSDLARLEALLAFAQTRFDSPDNDDYDPDALAAEVRVIAAQTPGPVRRHEALPIEALSALARELMDGLRNLSRGAGWKIPLRNAGRLIVPRASAGHGFENRYIADLRTRFLIGAADLLIAEGWRVRTCARQGCGRMYVRHKRGKFCSKSCQRKVMSERFFAGISEQEKRDRAHQYYINRIRRLNPKLASKVRQRPRQEEIK